MKIGVRLAKLQYSVDAARPPSAAATTRAAGTDPHLRETAARLEAAHRTATS
jgi:hypothetical protein